MTLSLTPRLAGVFAAVTLAALSAAPVAQAASHSQMGHGKKMAAAHSVYVCKDCKAFYPPAMAKKMGYKDSMGHTLVKQTKVPAGYMDGSKMKM